MAKEVALLHVRNLREWRAWLENQHASSAGIWLVFYKGQGRNRSIPYEESVREALCFGWIDSLIKRLDDDCYARKFTPRQPSSKWSEINRKRWAELKAADRLKNSGLTAAPTGNAYAARPAIPELPTYIAAAFKRAPAAWNSFRALARSHRREYVGWIHSAKRAETREKRIHESIRLLSAGKKLGLK
jgi:uncharacterized protein YdeI (YjbR/CyaY-like superfamily)